MKDKTKPLFHWYVDCTIGKELIFALYTRPCRYGKCTFCGLPTMSEGGEMVSAKDIEKQVDYILAEYTPQQLSEVAKVSIYTASSSLDQISLPTRSLMYLGLKICDFPKLKLFPHDSVRGRDSSQCRTHLILKSPRMNGGGCPVAVITSSPTLALSQSSSSLSSSSFSSSSLMFRIGTSILAVVSL